ncbi:hypothetical protein [Ureibacillus sp. FSL K6-2830]|uniref:hypothetical protein n=1 Tax=Ureibacillus sp. FSL K6-2830 TaxID=2954610 RepID=UPI0030F4CA2A
MPKIQIRNDILNLVQLQEELDGILFDYIDTSKKWDLAFEELKQLLDELVTYFKNYVRRKDGRLPESDMYWSLFIDIVSKIIYFNTIVYMNLVKEMTEEQKEQIKKSFHDAANCLPDVQGRNLEFLQEMSETFNQLFHEEDEFERYYLDKNNGLKDCIRFFNEFCNQYGNNILN